MCGPTGIGFLWGRADVLSTSPPFLGGGEMIDEVKLEGLGHRTVAEKRQEAPGTRSLTALRRGLLTNEGMDGRRVHRRMRRPWR